VQLGKIAMTPRIGTTLREYRFDQRSLSPFRLRGAMLPREMEIDFSSQHPETGSLWFDAGSEAEVRFLDVCRARSYVVGSNEFVCYSVSGVEGAGVYRIALNQAASFSRIHEASNVFGVRAGRCPHEDLAQIERVRVRAAASPSALNCLGTVLEGTEQIGFARSLLIVGRVLKDRLSQSGATGISFEPCLVAGRKYTESEKVFGSPAVRVHDEAQYFQVVFAEVAAPPLVTGFTPTAAASEERFCPVCKVAIEGWVGQATYSCRGLANVDWQLIPEQIRLPDETPLAAEQGYVGNRILVSGRMLNELLRIKPRGFSRLYRSAEPRIEVCGVRIAD
jgi:hypothetical protein